MQAGFPTALFHCHCYSLLDGSAVDCGSRYEKRFQETEQKETRCEADRVYEWKQEKWIETEFERERQENKHLNEM